MKIIIIIALVIVFRHFVLNILAGILYSILNIINSFVVTYKYGKNKKIKEWVKYNYDSAFNLDVYGQYNLRSLWNVIFSKGGYAFGTNVFETISSVLGWKKQEESLSVFGLIWYYILYAIDISKWFSGGHCYCSIDWKLHK